jgi:pimeloyl-ACP methyl ester carboxylesterase
VLQGVADLFSLVRWVKQSGGITAADSPTNKEIKLDSATIALMGHSQGATHSALALAYEPSVSGVVLSGNGGMLGVSLLAKTSPSDIASVIPLALLDPDKNFKLAADAFNAALALLQTTFDRADPVNFARHLQLQPTSEVPSGRHVFVTYGVGDTYAPVRTQAAYAHAARLTVVTPFVDDLKLPTAAAPLSLNETIGGTQRTVGLREYSPKDGEDGHFVAVEAGQNGRPDVERFLQQLLAKQTPEIGQ